METMMGYYSKCHITGTVPVEQIVETARNKGVYTGSFIDKSCYGERNVLVKANGDHWFVSCQECDDNEACYSKVGTLEECMVALKSYI